MIFKQNQHNEYGQKRALWYSYILVEKMRTTYFWKPIEPILEMRKIGDSYHRVGVAHYAALRPILEPRPLVCTTGFIEKDDMHTMRGMGSSQRIFSIFKPCHTYLASIFYPKWAY